MEQDSLCHPEWQRHVRAFEDLRSDARDLAADLTEAQAHWRPAPNRWSIADCLEHLNVTWEQYVPALRNNIEGAQTRRDPDAPVPESFRYGFLGNLMIRTLEPPPKLRVRAPSVFLPVAEDRSFEEICRRFEGFHDTAVELIDASRGLDLKRVRFSSPLSRLLRMSLGQWFGFLAAHERRHLWQARQVRDSAHFPDA